MKKKLGFMIASVLTAVPAANITAGLCLFNNTIVRSNISLEQTQSMSGVDWDKYNELIDEMTIALSETRTDEFYIRSYDGLKLYGQYFRHYGEDKNDVKKIVICFHGYTSYGGGNNSAAAVYFLNNGFDVLLPDARSHGNSEGEYIGFGCLDRYDSACAAPSIINISFFSDPQFSYILWHIASGMNLSPEPCINNIGSFVFFTSRAELQLLNVYPAYF